jgi:hypothetical protein
MIGIVRVLERVFDEETIRDAEVLMFWERVETDFCSDGNWCFVSCFPSTQFTYFFKLTLPTARHGT